MTALALAVALLLCVPAVSVITQAAAWPGEILSHLAGTVLGGYLAGTVLLLCAVVPGVVVVGGGCAWLVARHEFPGRRVLEWALLFPLAAPAYLLAYAYTDALQGILPSIRGMPAAAVLFVSTTYPYVYLLARATFLEQSPRLVEAARVLGLSPTAAFLRVALPLARPSLVAGAAMAAMEVAADFGTVEYFAVDTLGTGVFRTWYGLGSKAGAAVLAVLLLALAFALLAVERAARGKARYFTVGQGASGGSAGDLPRVPLRGAARRAATLACALPVVVGFLAPAGLLARLVVAGGWRHVDGAFLAMAARTFTLAAGAAIAACALGLVVAWAARSGVATGRRRGPAGARAGAAAGGGGCTLVAPAPPASPRLPTRSPWLARWHFPSSLSARAAGCAAFLASLGYAVPGAVLALGVLFPLGAFDDALASSWEALTGERTGLVLGGTVAALAYAYVVRFGAVPLQGFRAALARVSPSMEQAARVLGSPPAECLRRVHAPLVARSASAAFVLVLVDVVKELPATLVLRPLSFDTLAVHTYHLASDERLVEASSAALCIVAVGVIPVTLLARHVGCRGAAPKETT